ncbi:MAG: hypothetical protein KGD65_01840 [Candidatus Lokiarchaeota archaeon]|nr:hypothetical protein [Candidatus Lokiarchaeota archaeon]
MVLFFLIKKDLSFENVVDDIILGLENWCVAFNDFFLIFIQYIKYIFVFILLAIGILTLLRLRGIYLQPRLKKVEKEEDTLTKSRLILGTLYISFAFGILFNYGTYFLMWILDPLPDRIIFNFIEFSGINPLYLNGIKDISMAQLPHEKTIYYCFSSISLTCFLDIVLSLWYLINNNRIINNPRRTMICLFSGVTGCILFGFTPFLPFFL